MSYPFFPSRDRFVNLEILIAADFFRPPLKILRGKTSDYEQNHCGYLKITTVHIYSSQQNCLITDKLYKPARVIRK